jgi:hypothetical protein
MKINMKDIKMANTHHEIQDLLSIHLSTELRTKYDALLPLFAQITRLVSSFNNPCPERKQLLTQQNLDNKTVFYSETLISGIMKSASDSTGEIKIPLKYANQLLNYCLRSGQILARIACSMMNAQKKIGACQELSEISMALLIYYTKKVETQESFSIELMILSAVDLHDHGTHQFLVINRNINSDCENIKDWGNDCIIFDPSEKELFDIKNIPSSLSLASFLQSESCPYKISFGLCGSSKEFISFYGDNDLDQNCKDDLKKIHESIYAAFYQQLCNLLPPDFTNQIVYPCGDSMLCRHLTQKSGLYFAEILDSENYYTDLVAFLKTEEQVSRAQQLISSFKYGHIGEFTSGNKLLFFLTRMLRKSYLHLGPR